jgi:hypothetical protein
MTTNKKFYVLLWITLGLFCAGCDPSLNYYQIITNNTGKELNLILESNNFYRLDSFLKDDSFYFNQDSTLLYIDITIEPFSSDTIYYLGKIGFIDNIDSCRCEYSNMRFSGTDYIVTKDIMNVTNWIKEIIKEDRGGGGEVHCIFEINEGAIIRNK